MLFFDKAKHFYSEHERIIMPAAFLGGFIFDNFTLTRIDLLFDNLVLFSYLVIATLGIIITNLYKGGKLYGSAMEKIAPWLPMIVQFAFGGLFSGYIIFYARSASFAASWPFIVVLILLFIGNERFRNRYFNVTFQMSMLFLAVFSFLIFYVPIIAGSIGVSIFIVSGVASLLFMWSLLYVLSQFVPKRIKESRSKITASIISIYLLINVFYFTNIIPPIPLSLKEAGVYHKVERTSKSGDYSVLYEPPQWYEPFRAYNNTFHRTPKEPVYFFSAVFAPTRLQTNILHRWHYFDVGVGEWIETDRLEYLITGGRDGGYRGYTIKRNIIAGKWRVDVITERGALLGREKFEVKDVTVPPILKTTSR